MKAIHSSGWVPMLARRIFQFFGHGFVNNCINLLPVLSLDLSCGTSRTSQSVPSDGGRLCASAMIMVSSTLSTGMCTS